MSRSLSQWIEYIQTLHPRTIDLSLTRAAAVWEKFKPVEMPIVIAIAGTNGKGSSVSMLESIYRHAGYQTGAFTSPHLVHFNERICLNNVPVSDALLTRAFEEVEALRGDIRLTFFEFNTLLALLIFTQQKLDVILLEVGMGGRLDAVNIVENDLALITSIGLDHTAWLGNDREQIGAEKAGIIRLGGRVVLADPNAPDSLERIARLQFGDKLQAGRDYELETRQRENTLFIANHPRLRQYHTLEINSRLRHQQDNTAGVIAAAATLQNQLPVNRAQLEHGLAEQTLQARLQLIDGEPRLLLDVSHNEASVLAMLEFIENLSIKGQIHAIFGALADKRYNSAYQSLRKRIDAWYLTTLEGERGQTALALSNKLFNDEQKMTANFHLFDSPVAAFTQAQLMANKQDLIVIFGSFHLVGAIIPSIQT